MSYQIFFYESGSSKPIAKFIQNLSSRSHAKVLRSLDLLEKYGSELREPHVKKIQNKLFELRIKGQEEVRLLFVCSRGVFYILHAFKKKTNKISSKNLRLALKRLTLI